MAKKTQKKSITESPIAEHRAKTKALALSLDQTEVYEWLIIHGYLPEAYVLPPCYRVLEYRNTAIPYYEVDSYGKYNPTRTECTHVHYPKTELTDRNFGIIHPHIHHDIAHLLAHNWTEIVEAMIPVDSVVAPYSFPVPIDASTPGRIGFLRSGRMIYEFITMTDEDLASVAYRFTHQVVADIKNFFPSIYTHSLAWALHGKEFIRLPKNRNNYNLFGNRLDKLFQNASDGCTNGVPIGPAVSDIAGEIIAAAVDREFTKFIQANNIECEAVRFKDDYRILVSSEGDAKAVIKYLQAALKVYNLELSDPKTNVFKLPDGLFRSWVSMYHVAHPLVKEDFSWKEFRELYLTVLRIDAACPNTGVVDRFLSDITKSNGQLKVDVDVWNLRKVISMLLMLATLRIKSFPKVIAIIESVLKSMFGSEHKAQIVEYLESYLEMLAKEEGRNKYLISWIGYFLVSNDLIQLLSSKHKFKDPITKSIFENCGLVFKGVPDFTIFENCEIAAKRVSLFEHLDVFNPPRD